MTDPKIRRACAYLVDWPRPIMCATCYAKGLHDCAFDECPAGHAYGALDERRDPQCSTCRPDLYVCDEPAPGVATGYRPNPLEW